jgi:glycosyltransferase involved in cell wall biosynthesis
MGFADTYLEKQKNFTPSIKEEPDNNLKLIVVIPCYNEPHLIPCLDSIWNCIRPESAVEVFIVINSSVSAPEEIRSQNLASLSQFKEWEKDHKSDTFRYYSIFRDNLPDKYAGAGLARKIGMDESIYRFNHLNNPDGVIISFDADASCDLNYLVEIEKTFRQDPKINGCTVYFEHPIQGDQFTPEVYRGILQYELYLRYYVQGLKYAGVPYAFFTVGSCFAVRALGYVKVGGMNRRKAGEDFYFLHKLFPLGNISEVKTTRVIPSPRPSDRVYFGTGPFIRKFQENNKKEYLTYNFKTFILLRNFFSQIDLLFRSEEKDLLKFITSLPCPFQEFLYDIEFINRIDEINRNTATYQAFEKRFFLWFNAFMVLKFMNAIHKSYFNKIPVCEASGDLLKAVTRKGRIPGKAEELLQIFRRMEIGGGAKGR